MTSLEAIEMGLEQTAPEPKTVDGVALTYAWQMKLRGRILQFTQRQIDELSPKVLLWLVDVESNRGPR